MAKVFALIAARNEEASIGDTINSILNQTSKPEQVVVVVNNTTDNTAAVAREAGAFVLEMTENKHMKAGALNYGLDFILPSLDENDLILVVDADTTVSQSFIEVSLRHFLLDLRVGVVSSVFVGRDSKSWLGRMQAMEFHRYADEIRRRGGQAFVASGTASIFRVKAFRDVKASRDGEILPKGGSYYDTVSLTEDNEMTLALKTIGYLCPAPGATSTTDVLETTSDLYHQRKRWYLGALHNLAAYGRKLPMHLRLIYWRQQFGLYLAMVVTVLMAFSFALVVFMAIHGTWFFSPVWLIPSVVLLIERVVTVWTMGWRERFLAMSLVPEGLYSLFLLGTFACAAAQAAFVKDHRGSWRST